MIREQRASESVYEPGADVFRLTASEEAIARQERATVDLLLDAAGYLVGVDLGGSGFERRIVMRGPHEAVARTEPATAEIARDAEGAIVSVAIHGARALLRTDERDPYRG